MIPAQEVGSRTAFLPAGNLRMVLQFAPWMLTKMAEHSRPIRCVLSSSIPPEDFHIIGLELPIDRHDWNPFDHGLTDDQSIERVFVVMREFGKTRLVSPHPPLPWCGERADGGEGNLEFRCRESEVLGYDFIAVIARAAADAGAAVDPR